jgi:DNA ligase-associated metallophosphoesterase
VTVASRVSPSAASLRLNGIDLLADLSGALLWPEEATVVVADLHLEKASSFARRGVPLPPYDTRATLERLAAVIARCQAQRVICLGDSFHDAAGPERLAADDMARLDALVAGREWLWIAGNHDPALPDDLGGTLVRDALRLGPLVFRHAAAPTPEPGEVSGHFHPVAALRVRGHRVGGRCFVGDGRRLILPAFGSFTGGLDVRDPAIAGLFPAGFDVHLIGRARIVTLAGACLA